MTVSYAFSQPGRVAEHTLTHVLNTAQELGYHRPNGTARALRSGRTGQLGVVLGEHLSYAFDDPQAALLLAGVADVCVEHDLGLVLIPTHGDAGDVDRVLAAAVDAYVLWTRPQDDPVLRAVADSGRPAAIQGGPAAPGIVCIGPDDAAAARAVASRALDAAPVTEDPAVLIVAFPLDEDRSPASITADLLPEHIPFPVTRARLEGYRDAIKASGIAWESARIEVVERNTREAGALAMHRREMPEGSRDLVILAMSDQLALGVLEAASGSDHRLTVTGWDASPEALAAGVISVTNPLREQGELCARAALDPTTPVGPVRWEVVPVSEK